MFYSIPVAGYLDSNGNDIIALPNNTCPDYTDPSLCGTYNTYNTILTANSIIAAAANFYLTLQASSGAFPQYGRNGTTLQQSPTAGTYAPRLQPVHSGTKRPGHIGNHAPCPSRRPSRQRLVQPAPPTACLLQIHRVRLSDPFQQPNRELLQANLQHLRRQHGGQQHVRSTQLSRPAPRLRLISIRYPHSRWRR